jgi:2-polyprenyl-3-methyl-5-hydroxy-6-metoxy-1,4-benzoquinol methylase
VEGYFPDALAGSDKRFDCIVLNDVLEHMLDPWSVVTDLRRLLRR